MSTFKLKTLSKCEDSGNFSYGVELENIMGSRGQARTPWRSGASNGASLRFYRGDRLIVNVCFLKEVKFTLAGILYSNDGGVDNVDVFVNGRHAGEFNTRDHSEGGHLWNRFYSSGILAQHIELPSGKHEIEIKVADSDCYGLELDLLVLTFEEQVDPHLLYCDGRVLLSLDPTVCALHNDGLLKFWGRFFRNL